jgi:hypothetical protein
MRKRFTDHPDEMTKAAAASVRREIPDDFKYDKKKLKHLKHILHNSNVALGTLTSILNEFAKLKGPDISPDGLLGGIGYIIPVKEVKQAINNAVHGLSDIADCIADELTNPKWNAEDDKEVKELIKEKDEAIEKVEEEINPDDVNVEEAEEEDVEDKNMKKEEQPSVEEPDMEPDMGKEARTKQANDALSQAVQQSLVKFYSNQ